MCFDSTTREAHNGEAQKADFLYFLYSRDALHLSFVIVVDFLLCIFSLLTLPSFNVMAHINVYFVCLI
jgi:hypothetical protein